MGNYTIFRCLEILGKAGNKEFYNILKILDLKSSSEQIFFENWHWVPLQCGSCCWATQSQRLTGFGLAFIDKNVEFASSLMYMYCVVHSSYSIGSLIACSFMVLGLGSNCCCCLFIVFSAILWGLQRAVYSPTCTP